MYALARREEHDHGRHEESECEEVAYTVRKLFHHYQLGIPHLGKHLQKVPEPEPEPKGPGNFYGTIDFELMVHPQAILAYQMNGKPLTIEHGVPIRLRVETRLSLRWSSGSALQRSWRIIRTWARGRADGARTTSTTTPEPGSKPLGGLVRRASIEVKHVSTTLYHWEHPQESCDSGDDEDAP